MTDKKTTQVLPGIFKGLSKQEIDELVKCASIESAHQRSFREGAMRLRSLNLLDEIRRDYVEARRVGHERKIIIFLSYDCYRGIGLALIHGFDGTRRELEESGTLWGCDVKLFEDAPTRDPKNRHKNRGLDYYIHIQCVGRS